MPAKLRALGCGILVLAATLGGVTAQDKDKKIDKAELKPRRFELKEEARESFKLTFVAGQKVEIRVDSERETDVDLFVYDAENKQIASDTRGGKTCYVTFTPAKTQVYKIEVANLGPGDNVCTVYFGAIPKSDTVELKPFSLKEDGEKIFSIQFAEGVKAEIWIDSEKNTDVDLYVYDAAKEKVASDTRISKDCHVAFTPKKTQTYQILVVNLGPGENRCKLRHSIAKPDQKTDAKEKKDKDVKKS